MSAPSPSSASQIDLDARQARQRLTRVATFAGELAAALRKEFGALWVSRAVEAQDQGVLAFKARVDQLAAQARALEEFLSRSGGLSAAEAVTRYSEYPVDAVTAGAKGLDGLARMLRADPRVKAMIGRPQPPASAVSAPRARSTGALAATGATRPLPAPSSLLDRVRRWASAVQVDELAPSTRPPTAVDRAREAFVAAHDLVTTVLAKVTPRVRLLDISLGATGLPGPKQPWPHVKAAVEAAPARDALQPAHAAWLLPLAKLFYMDAMATQRAHGAVVQWGQAQEARKVAETMATRPDALGEFNVGRYRAAVLPLTHLHLTFRGVRVLQELFPMPPDGAAQPARRSPNA